MEYMPKVLQAVAGEDFTLYLYFSDGSVRLTMQSRFWNAAACLSRCGTKISFGSI